ncbi:hypothetical protein Tcan_16319 [Toxocara canis]|uniref:Uncharacterized protein n=1 Tax=Toxocara canis TaxID=6265 RepID=A0A0B2VWU5_TOXCA|nr:hypothetical protein Tcan_16319 [Toxocara canis]
MLGHPGVLPDDWMVEPTDEANVLSASLVSVVLDIRTVTVTVATDSAATLSEAVVAVVAEDGMAKDSQIVHIEVLIFARKFLKMRYYVLLITLFITFVLLDAVSFEELSEPLEPPPNAIRSRTKRWYPFRFGGPFGWGWRRPWSWGYGWGPGGGWGYPGWGYPGWGYPGWGCCGGWYGK